MINTIDAARGIAHQYLNYIKSNGTVVELQTISEVINDKILGMFPDLDIDELIGILLSDYSVGSGLLTSLTDDDITPWLKDKKSEINWQGWNRYKLYLQDKDPAFPINDLDDFTDKILDKCVNPQQDGSWDRRGMVVGHVQSGKTSNYVGLINKAVDSGYKLIIVIAGTMNSLRRQTQERIDEGFVGKNSSDNLEEKIIGVGEYLIDSEIFSLTSSSIKTGGDFDQSIASRKGIPIGRSPVVLVIKKNKGILENLIEWLSSQSQTKNNDGFLKLYDVPTLIIDDEADSASINTVSGKKTKEEALSELKTINRNIRILINLFDKKTFIGYTATPYANLFIPQEWNEEVNYTIKGNEYLVGQDLFPKDFIINIKAAKNYIGASKIFGYYDSENNENQEPIDIFRPIFPEGSPFFITKEIKDSDEEVIYRQPTNKDPRPDYLPESLKIAIKSFILTCTIRRLRGQEKKHNSMLVHAVLYVKWIDCIAKLVNEQLRKYKNLIEGNDPMFIEELRVLFESDFIPTTLEILEEGRLGYNDIKIKISKWEEVKPELIKASSKIEVRAVHGVKSKSNLLYDEIEEIDYNLFKENGLSVIAVGGSRLARGITLEGLSISYYLRASKMYDSLMQMGRWFGYRPGYVDLCRLYTTYDLFDWFNHITDATEEMRRDFDEMSSLNLTPSKFKLKVRNHKGLLSITSVSKLYFSEEIDISFSGTNIQTYFIEKSDKSLNSNFNVFKKLLSNIGVNPEVKLTTNKRIKYLIFKNVNITYINDFILSYSTKQPSINSKTISDYILSQNLNGNIKEWSIVVVSNSSNKIKLRTDKKKYGGLTTEVAVRPIELNINNEIYHLGASLRNQLGNESRKSKFYSIEKNQIDDPKDRIVDLLDATNKNQRKIERKGLILIYLLDERGTEGVKLDVPIVGFSIYFPKIDNEERVKYTVTQEVEEEEENDDDNYE
jgi:hypothetical protein